MLLLLSALATRGLPCVPLIEPSAEGALCHLVRRLKSYLCFFFGLQAHPRCGCRLLHCCATPRAPSQLSCTALQATFGQKALCFFIGPQDHPQCSCCLLHCCATPGAPSQRRCCLLHCCATPSGTLPALLHCPAGRLWTEGSVHHLLFHICGPGPRLPRQQPGPALWPLCAPLPAGPREQCPGQCLVSNGSAPAQSSLRTRLATAKTVRNASHSVLS